jgi:hypothetical protein
LRFVSPDQDYTLRIRHQAIVSACLNETGGENVPGNKS